ncbi:hypothetical protein DSECCO2_120260 [anaerobic digester metagenome]
MKTVCIYHSIDLDGWMSAAIVKRWFKGRGVKQHIQRLNDDLDFIGYNHGQPIPDLSEYDRVIMCDISFKLTIGNEIDKINPMFNLIDKLKDNFIWIDHHISAINDITAYSDEYDYDNCWPIGLRDTKYAACELTWKYFFPNEPMPEIVRLLGMYDSFRHKGTSEETKVLEFQYGARSVISNYDEAYRELCDNIYCENTELGIWNKGKAIYSYLCTEAKQTYANGFVIKFEEDKEYRTGRVYEFICINNERFNPINFGIDYHKDGYDGCACFHYADGVYNFSVYNDNGNVDCSAIAKQFGGGGHKGAAGFRLNVEQFNKLINDSHNI